MSHQPELNHVSLPEAALSQRALANTAAPPRQTPRQSSDKCRRPRLVLTLAAIGLVTAILISGAILRIWIFQWSTPAHYTPDMRNIWDWGSFTLKNTRHNWIRTLHHPGIAGTTLPIFLHRLADVYRRSRVLPQSPAGYRLDYPTWRIAVAAIWVWIERSLHPYATVWRPRYMTPLLWLNTVMELFGFIGIFLLVRHWVLRQSQPFPSRRKFRDFIIRGGSQSTNADLRLRTFPSISWKPWLLGLFAASLFWFNPNVIQSAHTWVQYDVWVIPFYIAGLYLVSVDLFFLAGVIIAIGSLLKGQELFCAAMFILWPIFEGMFLRAWEYIVGFVLAAGLCNSIWLLAGPADWYYLAGVFIAGLAGVAWIIVHNRVRWFYAVLFTVPTIPLALWPWWNHTAHGPPWMALVLTVWLVVGPWLFRPHRAWFFWATEAALAMAVIAISMPTHWMWLKTGFLFGASVHHTNMLSLPNADGLGLILQDNFHWGLTEKVFTLNWPVVYTVNMRLLLVAVVALTMLVCAWAAARHHRRNNPRFLLAMITPWITFFAFAPCMFERYLLWGSAMLVSVAVAFDVGLVLLGLLLSVLSFFMTLTVQLEFNQFKPHWLALIQSAEPGIAYAVVLAALICLYCSLRSGRRKPCYESAETKPSQITAHP